MEAERSTGDQSQPGVDRLDQGGQVQDTLRTFFETFRRTGSASATVRSFRERTLLFPRRLRSGSLQGELAWSPLLHWHALRVRKNRRYAGAYAFGRTRSRKTLTGQDTRVLPREQWHTLLLDAHPGYLTWAEHEDNFAPPARERPGPAQESGARRTGPFAGAGRLWPVRAAHDRSLQGASGTTAAHLSLPAGWHCEGAADLSADRGSRLGCGHRRAPCGSGRPLALEVTLAVQQELEARAEEVYRLRREHLERARYEAELAQRRYLRVDPDNRLVVDSLEADWNQKLRALAAAQEEYERQRKVVRRSPSEQQRGQIMALATDFPRLWSDPQTKDRERKRMVRLMLEDVTLLRTEWLIAHVRFRGVPPRPLTFHSP